MEGRGKIFVLMPFRDEFDDVYMVIGDAVRSAAEELAIHISCLRADEIDKPGRITDQILSSIKDSDLIVADLTNNNPNVMYELGYAHALGKPTIILNQDVHSAPFDVADFRQITYDRSRLVKDCRPRLIASIMDIFGPGHGEYVIEQPSIENSSLPEKLSPLRPSSALVAALHKLNLKINLGRTKGNSKVVQEAAREVRQLLDRVTVVSSGDQQDINNTAATAGNCAVALENADMLSEAEDIFKRALGLFPDYPGLHLQYADFLADNDRFDEASVELSRARELNEDDPRIRRVEVKIGIAGGRANAELAESLRVEFERDPSSDAVAAAYVLYLHQSGAPMYEYEAACQRWEESLPHEKKSIPRRILADRLASSHEVGQRSRAIEIYEALLREELGSDRVDVLHNLATLYNGLGDKARARMLWEEAYDLNPGEPAVQASFSQFLARHDEIELAFKVANGEPITPFEKV